MKAKIEIDCPQEVLNHDCIYEIKVDGGKLLGTSIIKEDDSVPIKFIEEIIHRDICLVYRGCLLMLLEKWRDENENH